LFQYQSKRALTDGVFSGWLNTQWNKVDSKRLKEVGPDRLCAEWLLRCGAACRLQDKHTWLTDYNSLSALNLKSRIEAIDCSDSCVNSSGFAHLKGLEELNSLKISRCLYFGDSGLVQLSQLQPGLRRLSISGCPQISARGLNALKFHNLTRLELSNLPGVESPSLEDVLVELRNELKGCLVTTELEQNLLYERGS